MKAVHPFHLVAVGAVVRSKGIVNKLMKTGTTAFHSHLREIIRKIMSRNTYPLL